MSVFKKIDSNYLDYLFNNYAIIPKDDKCKIINPDKDLIKIKYIKCLNKEEYFPTFSYGNFKDKKFVNKNSKSIFNNSQMLEQLNRYKCLYGDKMNCLVLLKYKEKENNKKSNKDIEKINFFKVNHLGKIVRAPEEYEILQFIDSDKWYVLDNTVYRIASHDIDNNRVCIENISFNKSTRKNLANLWKNKEYKIFLRDLFRNSSKNSLGYLKKMNLKEYD